MFKYILWYIYLSSIDWTIHRYILHSKINTNIRRDHRIHHYAHDNNIKLDTGTAFCLSSALIIYVITVIPVAILSGAWGTVGHLLAVIFGFGIHNYAHMKFHGHNHGLVFSIPIPEWWLVLLHNNHKKHHLNPKTCYCTAYLGFDYIVGTF